MIRFLRPPSFLETHRRSPADGAVETFEFLGFTHYWGRSRLGKWVVKRKTAASRFTRSLKRIAEWCRDHRHYPVPWQHEQLVLKLRGYGAYYAITGNLPLVRAFRDAVERLWCKWLNRRSQRRDMPWERFARLLQRYPLPVMRIVRPAAVS